MISFEEPVVKEAFSLKLIKKVFIVIIINVNLI
jgi:hypothetical protein